MQESSIIFIKHVEFMYILQAIQNFLRGSFRYEYKPAPIFRGCRRVPQLHESSRSVLYYADRLITQQIHALEDSLGVPLFDRTSRPITLTPAGSAFLNDARSILDRIDQAVNRIQEVSTGMVGTLRIGYTKGFERSNFSSSLRFFHNKYPNILVSCYRRNTDLLAAGLLKDEYDIIFTWDSTELVKNDSIEYRLIERSPLMVAVYGAIRLPGGHLCAARSFTGNVSCL